VFLQFVLGYSVIKSGLVLTPLAAVVIVSAPLAGIVTDRIGPKWPMFVGMVIAAVGFFLTMRVMYVGASWQSLAVPLAVSGFGIGMVMPPSTSAVMGSVVTAKAGQASGVLSTVRQTGSVLGIAVMGALLQNRAVAYFRDSVGAKLDAAPFPLGTEVKQQITDALGSVTLNMDDLRSGAGMGGAMPEGAADILGGLPASAAEHVSVFFRDVFGLDVIMSEFAHAMRTTYLFSIILVSVGAILALLVGGSIKRSKSAK
jgi:MFS family permease